jgi:hypothetical protein
MIQKRISTTNSIMSAAIINECGNSHTPRAIFTVVRCKIYVVWLTVLTTQKQPTLERTVKIKNNPPAAVKTHCTVLWISENVPRNWDLFSELNKEYGIVPNLIVS